MEILRLTDYGAVCTAYEAMAEVFPDLPGRVNIEEYLDKLSKFANVYVLKNNNSVCGFCAAYMNDAKSRTAYITLIGIHSNYRHQGLGSRLFTYCEEQAGFAGMNRLKLEVNKDNGTAIAFYKKHGMEIVGQASEVGFYMEKGL